MLFRSVAIPLADGATLRLRAADLAQARRNLPRSGSFHANREPFLRQLLTMLARDRATQRREDADDPEVRAEIIADLVDDPAVRRTLNLMWLPTDPEQVIRRLLSDPDALARAAAGVLSAQEQRLLLRPTDAPWTVDDVPLLDEAADRLGPWVAPSRTTARAHADDPTELYVDDGRERHTTTLEIGRAHV